MESVTRFFRKLGLLLRRKQFDRDLEDEMRLHREMQEQEMLANGMALENASAAVRRQFGNETRLKEQSHEVVDFRIESVFLDLRFALRQLRRNSGFTTTAIGILTLGMGACVAIFGFVDAALIKPLPYQAPSRLAILYEAIALGPRYHVSYLDYLDWKKLNKTFSSLDVYEPDGFVETTRDGKMPADGASVSAGFFQTLGVRPVLGRDFLPGEDAVSAPRAVLLSYGAWQKRYGGRRDVIGQSVVLDGKPNTIVGVLPPDFHFAPAEPADFWMSLHGDGDCEKHRGCHNLYGIARLRDGVAFQSGLADLTTISRQLEKQYPDSNRDQVANMLPLSEAIVGDIRPILLVMLGGAGLLLMIATVNVASLLLVRSEARRREISVRSALGASSVRLLRQFVVEGLVLVAGGSALGLTAAWIGMQWLTKLIPKDIFAGMPYLRELTLSPHVILFAISIAGATAFIFAATPSLRLSTLDLREGLAEGGRSHASSLWRRVGANLVIVELATAMVLLVGAGLLGKSFYRLLHVDTGMETDHLAVLNIAATGDSYTNSQQTVALAREISSRVSGLPSVESVAFANRLPLGDGDGTITFNIVGRPPDKVHREVALRQVSANYLATLHARLLRGRYFRENEDESNPRVIVINQALAQKYFQGEDPVGKRISFAGQSPDEIVGVIDDIQEAQLDAAPIGAMYVPYNQSPSTYFSVIVRTAKAEQSLLPMLVSTIHQVDAGLSLYGADTMNQRLHDSPSAYLHRTSAYMVGGFAAIALMLGVVGLYGVIAYSVSQRTREIGVRMAMGAQRGSVYSLILKEAARLSITGITVGICVSLLASGLIRNLLFGVKSWDLETLAGVAFLLGISALLASYIPARRAASVNPVDALRSE